VLIMGVMGDFAHAVESQGACRVRKIALADVARGEILARDFAYPTTTDMSAPGHS
jgi:hypothetical protein